MNATSDSDCMSCGGEGRRGKGRGGEGKKEERGGEGELKGEGRGGEGKKEERGGEQRENWKGAVDSDMQLLVVNVE